MQLPGLDAYTTIWAVDYEYQPIKGESPIPLCLVAHELRSGKRLALWEDVFRSLPTPPYDIGADSLFVAYNATAEYSCHLALGWPLPENTLDLYPEFRNASNGQPVSEATLLIEKPTGKQGLLIALNWYDFRGIDAGEKLAMQDLARKKGLACTPAEQQALLAYCGTDVDALLMLLPAMLAHGDIDLPYALMRGRYQRCSAHIEHRGIPVDNDLYTTLCDPDLWAALRLSFVTQDNPVCGHVYEGDSLVLSRFAAWVASLGIAWPCTESGRPEFKAETLESMAALYPAIETFRQMRASLSKATLREFAIGPGGRNRAEANTFGTVTARNAVKAKVNLLGAASWMRSLIRAQPGHALIYADWGQQEWAIVAILSGDAAMLQAYESGDPYMAFCKRAGAAPADATKHTHPHLRELYKTCSLGMLFGMGAHLLARKTGLSIYEAQDLIDQHKHSYPEYWRMCWRAERCAREERRLETVFRWTLHCSTSHRNGQSPTKPGTIRNFAAQANASEMLRLATVYAVEEGLPVCATLHDAILLEVPIDQVPDVTRRVEAAMGDASMAVLEGYRLKNDVEVFPYPSRYTSEKGATMWAKVQQFLASNAVSIA